VFLNRIERATLQEVFLEWMEQLRKWVKGDGGDVEESNDKSWDCGGLFSLSGDVHAQVKHSRLVGAVKAADSSVFMICFGETHFERVSITSQK
jgi:hypothetical protein